MTTPPGSEYGEGIDYTEIRMLYRALGRIPKEFRREMRPKLRDAARGILHDAAGAAMWSSRIPRSLSLEVSFSQRRPGVRVRASLSTAPHARVYEGILSSWFKHPLFGNRGYWFDEQARPFLLPAAQAGAEDVRRAAVEIVEEVNRRVGLA